MKVAKFNLVKELAIVQSVTLDRKRDALENEFRDFQARGNANYASDRARFLEIKDLLKAIDNELVEGNIVRSKEQCVEVGEKPTRYFSQLESKQQSRNSITELRVTDNSTVTDKAFLKKVLTFMRPCILLRPPT